MLIVVPPKRVDLLLRVVQRREPVHVQTLFAKSSVERFDRGVVGQFAATTEVLDDTVGVRPQVRRGATTAVVAVDPLRRAACKAKALERGDNDPATQTLADVDGQAFPREEIEHVEGAEASAVRQLIGDEVHAPDVITRRRWPPLLAMNRRHMAPRMLSPKYQALLHVQAIASLLSESPAFAPQEHEEPTIANLHAPTLGIRHRSARMRALLGVFPWTATASGKSQVAFL